ncbi:unnamed protein product [Lactuca saligna]|uniref:Uncharacterized protein n=1 Tax=Lactuca saligna TaxID=75948 RepID=A0AA35ZN85_LACSI|nr:unnamed protein product [Lactuca saligna]
MFINTTKPKTVVPGFAHLPIRSSAATLLPCFHAGHHPTVCSLSQAALLDAERTVQVALGKASMVDDLQNKNQELMKQIEICQVLLKMLPSYYKHVHAHDNTLITKFYGLHQITLRVGKKIYVFSGMLSNFRKITLSTKSFQDLVKDLKNMFPL